MASMYRRSAMAYRFVELIITAHPAVISSKFDGEGMACIFCLLQPAVRRRLCDVPLADSSTALRANPIAAVDCSDYRNRFPAYLLLHCR